jgi:phage terminase small subunit
MSNRGSIEFATTKKRLQSVPSEPATETMDPPQFVKDDPIALDYWNRHTATLLESGCIHPVLDRDIWALNCKTYSLVVQQDTSDNKGKKTYLDLMAQHQKLSRQFFLLPMDRRKAAVTFVKPRHDDKDEFEL